MPFGVETDKRLLQLRPSPRRRLALLRQRVQFHDSRHFWERRYAQGGNSGAGSYGGSAEAKARFLNSFVQERGVGSVIEFGCGDGHQLSLARYPSYIGLDVSESALLLCKRIFRDDTSKSFFLYNQKCFVDNAQLFVADAALSLDVLYHLVVDEVFFRYMRHLFAAARNYVIIYSTNESAHDAAPHVRHRRFTPWVESHAPDWLLKGVTPGPVTGPGRPSFFLYCRANSGLRYDTSAK